MPVPVTATPAPAAPAPIISQTPAPQTPPATPAPAPAPAPAEQDKLNSERFAQLSKKEKDIVLREQSIKAQMKEIDGHKAQIAKFEELKAAAKKNPKLVLDTFGVTLDEVAKGLVNSEDIDHSKRPLTAEEVDERIEKLATAKVEEFKEQQQKTERQKSVDSFYQQTLKEIDNTLTAEAFPLASIEKEGNKQEIFNIITEQYKQTGEIMTYADAAKHLEDYLGGQVKRYLESSSVKKMIVDLGYTPPVDKGANPGNNNPESQNRQTKPGKRPSNPPRTLTNQTSAAPTPPVTKKLSRAEKIALITGKHVK